MKFVSALLLSLSFLLLFSAQSSLAGNSDLEKKLTGVWDCDDGGTYYIKLIGRDVYWLGESADGGKRWTNIFIGKLAGRSIKGSWSDVPKGGTNNYGTIDLQLSPDGLSFTKVSGGQGFKGKVWRRSVDGNFKTN
jgi:hypothetical protein